MMPIRVSDNVYTLEHKRNHGIRDLVHAWLDVLLVSWLQFSSVTVFNYH